MWPDLMEESSSKSVLVKAVDKEQKSHLKNKYPGIVHSQEY